MEQLEGAQTELAALVNSSDIFQGNFSNLTHEQNEEFLQVSSAFSERIFVICHKLLQTWNEKEQDAPPDIKDILVDLNLPKLQRYQQIQLWKKITKVNRTVARRQLAKGATPEAGGVEAAPEATTFRDYYMSLVTDAFGQELDALRQEEEEFDQNKMNQLVAALESGIALASPLEQHLVVEDFKRRKKK